MSRFDNARKGIAAILFAVALLSFSDALVKLAGDRFGLAQLVLLRSLVAAALIGGILGALVGPGSLRMMRPAWVTARSLSLAGMWLCYYAALPHMSLAMAAACYYTTPVWMALMSRVFLGAEIGERGWSAIGISIAGVLMVVGPQQSGLSPVLLLPLAAAGFYALAGVITWARCSTENAGAMALNLNVTLVAAALIGLAGLALFGTGEQDSFLLSVWPELRIRDWALIGLLGALMAVIAVAVAMAYRLAPTPTVGVFDSAYLGFAAFWGIVFFADMPSLREAAGIAVIALGAMVMSRRDSHRDGDWHSISNGGAPAGPPVIDGKNPAIL